MLGRRGTASEARRRPLLVGLTGNFGTGKSTVAQFFKRKGAEVISADPLAREAFKKGNRIYRKTCSLFPELKGRLNRNEVAEIVFRNPKKRRALESVVHPYVFDRIQEELERAKKTIVILEVPLLFESGFHRECDQNIVVKAATRQVVRRLGPKGYPRPRIEARWRVQMPVKEKIRRADYVIDNSDGLRNTKLQVERIWKELLNLERSLSAYGKREK